MTATAAFRFDNSYARDLKEFAVPWRPAAVPAPKWLFFNRALAEELGLDVAALDGDAGAALFAGNAVPDGAEPIAQAYAGHQFGGFSPQLGDGRALLLGEVIDRAGRRRDIAIKGSGRTPFSRGGDGKAAVGPMLREVLIGEAMHALGIPTTRALAVVATGEPVFREDVLPGAVLTRVAASHIRVGTFQFFAARGEVERVRQLAEYTIARHDPALVGVAAPLPRAARERRRAPGRADRAMDERRLHPRRDEHRQHDALGRDDRLRPLRLPRGLRPGRGVQLDRRCTAATRSATSPTSRCGTWRDWRRRCCPCWPTSPSRRPPRRRKSSRRFPRSYRRHLLRGQRAKLGLRDAGDDGADAALADEWLSLLHAQRVDFTLAWRRLADAAEGNEAPLRALLTDAGALDGWLARWRERCARDESGARPAAAPFAAERAAQMRRVNPFVIARNHRVEEALAAASSDSDLAPFERLLAALRQPYDETPELAPYGEPAPAAVTACYRTFCGT